jgi:hypothetical protein
MATTYDSAVPSSRLGMFLAATRSALAVVGIGAIMGVAFALCYTPWRPHTLNLLTRSVVAMPSSVSNNWFGFVVFFVAVPAITFGLKWKRKGWDAVMEHWDGARDAAITLACAFVFLLGWSVIRTTYNDHQALLDRIKTLHNENVTLVNPASRDNRITELEAQVKELKKGVGHVPIRTPASVPSGPTLDPDSFYQFGNVVATVDGAVPDLPNGKITFGRIRPNETLNPDKDVQYREWTLRCIDGGRPLPSARMPPGMSAGRVFPGSAIGWSCSIVGK